LFAARDAAHIIGADAKRQHVGRQGTPIAGGAESCARIFIPSEGVRADRSDGAKGAGVLTKIESRHGTTPLIRDGAAYTPAR
jgi:hypothetical protein